MLMCLSHVYVYVRTILLRCWKPSLRKDLQAALRQKDVYSDRERESSS